MKTFTITFENGIRHYHVNTLMGHMFVKNGESDHLKFCQIGYKGTYPVVTLDFKEFGTQEEEQAVINYLNSEFDMGLTDAPAK